MLDFPPSAWLTTAIYARHRHALGKVDDVSHDLVVTREFRREEWAYLIHLASARPRPGLAERLWVALRALAGQPVRRSSREESRGWEANIHSG